MKWIKASERLPKESGRYYCKVNDESVFKGVFFFMKQIGSFPFRDDVVEWLDESEESKTDFQIAWELCQTRDKPFFVDEIRKLINVLLREEITMSKFVEELNTSSFKWAQMKLNEKDLIIHGIEEGAELWKAEYDNCRSILEALVSLKNLKDKGGKTEEYLKAQPFAWATAKKFLEQYQHQ